jgi:hypothetical protein
MASGGRPHTRYKITDGAVELFSETQVKIVLTLWKHAHLNALCARDIVMEPLGVFGQADGVFSSMHHQRRAMDGLCFILTDFSTFRVNNGRPCLRCAHDTVRSEREEHLSASSWAGMMVAGGSHARLPRLFCCTITRVQSDLQT